MGVHWNLQGVSRGLRELQQFSGVFQGVTGGVSEKYQKISGTFKGIPAGFRWKGEGGTRRSHVRFQGIPGVWSRRDIAWGSRQSEGSREVSGVSEVFEEVQELPESL